MYLNTVFKYNVFKYCSALVKVTLTNENIMYLMYHFLVVISHCCSYCIIAHLFSFPITLKFLLYCRVIVSFFYSSITLKGVVKAKMVKIIYFLLIFALKVSSGSGAFRPKFLGG